MVDCFRSGEETMKFIRFLCVINFIFFSFIHFNSSYQFSYLFATGFENLDEVKKYITEQRGQGADSSLEKPGPITHSKASAGVVLPPEANARAAASVVGNCTLEEGQLNAIRVQIKKDLSSCETSQTAANIACMGAANLGTAFGGIGVLLPMIQGAKSQGEVCKAHGSILEKASKALNIYNLECGGVKFTCETICKSSIAKLEKQSAELTTVNTEIAQEIEFLKAIVSTTPAQQKFFSDCINDGGVVKKIQAEINNHIAKAKLDYNICEGYGAQLMGSMVSLLSTLQKKNNDAQCACVLNPDTKDCQCQKDPTLEICQQQLDCNDPKNTANVTCICQKNNKIAGCPSTDNSTKPLQATRQQSNQARFSDDSSNTNPNIGGGNGALPESNYAGNNAGGGANALGSGGGGGSPSLGGSGGSFGGAGNAKNEKDKKGSGLNANVIGGYEGGGGGFGFGGSYGRFGDDEHSKIDPALEAKARAAARGLASQQGTGVTGSGGKDNFQKVRENYQSQKQSLLNR